MPDDPSTQTDSTATGESHASALVNAASPPAEGPSRANEGTDDPRLVPVTEAIRYRKRAQAAEQELKDAKGRLQDLTAELGQARAAIDQLDRRQRIDEMLADADAADLEVARLLTEAAVEAMDEPDVALAVADLKRHKPYLFRLCTQPGASAMPAHHQDAGAHQAEQAAQRAIDTGDRRDLLRYLRMRRKT